MATGVAATVDSSLRNITCFLIGKLQYNATSDNGDNKIGCKTTKISWKERPTFWPKDICFVNPNMNLTTAEKWSMLFAAISCLHKKGIDKVLSTSEKKAFCVEMMALESSNLDIINQCHSLRELMKLDLTCLEYPLMKEIFQERLRSYGFTLVAMSSGLECNRLPSVYDDLEKKCRTGQRPDFLKKLKSFRSMESLDAEVALTVARECLEHKSTRTKRQGSSPGPRDNNKKAKTSQNSSQNAGKQATGTTVPSLMIQTTASAIPYPPYQAIQTTTSSTPITQVIQMATLPLSAAETQVKKKPARPKQSTRRKGMLTTTSPIPTFQTPVMQTAAPPFPTIPNLVMQTTVPPLSTTQIPVKQATASKLWSTQYQSMQTTASLIPNTPLYVMPTTIQNRMMQTTASSIPTIPNAVMQRTASPLHIIHNQVMPTTLPSSQNPMTLTFASPIPTTQSPVIQSTASPVQPTQSQVLRSATSPRPVGQSPVISFDASYTTAATTHLRSQPVCTTSVISTQTTVTTSTVSPVNTNDPLLSSSGSHRYLISLDTSNMSLHDQARNIRDNAFPVSSTWTPWTQEPDSASTLYPDLD